MYDPIINITPAILKDIGQIEAARAVIENSPLLPLYERKFRAEATIRKVHFSTAIEGNYLQMDEVAQIIGSISTVTDSSGEQVVARQRDLHEVINYRDVVAYIEKLVTASRADSGVEVLSDEIVRKIHTILLKNIMDDSAGHYRKHTAVTVNFVTGEKLYPYENAENIEARMKDLLAWHHAADDVHPILKAGLLHLELVRIHPFEEGNGRTARSIATLSLSAEGYDVGHFFCLDEYYDSNAQDYYDYLGKGFANPTDWLEYFSLGMSVEFNRIRDRVIKMSKDAKIKKSAGQMFITERQENILEWLNNHGYFRNQDFIVLFPDISDDTVLRELKGLVDAKIIVKKGKTKSARYELK